MKYLAFAGAIAVALGLFATTYAAPSSEAVGATTTITVLEPNGGEDWVIGGIQPIEWTSTGASSTDLVTIRIRNASTSEVFVLADETQNFGRISVVVPNVPVGNYKLGIKFVDLPVFDASDYVFQICVATSSCL